MKNVCARCAPCCRALRSALNGARHSSVLSKTYCALRRRWRHLGGLLPNDGAFFFVPKSPQKKEQSDAAGFGGKVAFFPPLPAGREIVWGFSPWCSRHDTCCNPSGTTKKASSIIDCRFSVIYMCLLMYWCLPTRASGLPIRFVLQKCFRIRPKHK